MNRNAFGSIGRCIYCGATEGLTDEHIVPRYLRGEGVLHDASCPPCCEITKKFEQVVAREMMGRSRALTGDRWGNESERPKAFPMWMLIDWQWREVMVPIEEFPSAWMAMPLYRPPGVLLDLTPYSGFPDLKWAMLDPLVPDSTDRVQQLMKKYRATMINSIPTRRPREFALQLAKIAHAQAAAVIGLENFDPVLPDLILGKADHLNHYVGISNSKAFPPLNGQRWLIRPFTVTTTPVPYGGFAIRFYTDKTPSYSMIFGKLTPAGLAMMTAPDFLAKPVQVRGRGRQKRHGGN